MMRIMKLSLLLLAFVGFVASMVGTTSANGGEVVTNLADVKPIVMPKPPFQYFLHKSVKPRSTTQKLSLSNKSVKKRNFDDSYFDSPAYSSQEYEISNPLHESTVTLPPEIPTSFKGEQLVRAIKGKDRVFLVYGIDFGQNRYLVIMDKQLKHFLHAFDFTGYEMSPKYVKADYDFIHQQIQWVAEEGGILYISHGHRTYAKSSDGMNAYITAIRLSDHSVLWRSAPLVSNTRNFVISGDVILTGYGFTAEKDYLIQLDKRTGKVLDKILLKDAPEYLDKRSDGRLIVHGYSVVTQWTVKQPSKK